MKISELSVGDEIELPPLSFKPIREGCGTVNLFIRNSCKSKIKKIDIHKIGSRNERIFTFDSGERILVSAIKHKSIPKEIDKAVFVSSRNRGWLRHPLLEGFQRSRKSKKSKEIFVSEVFSHWDGTLQTTPETKDASGKVDKVGLRPPQVGGLYATGAHWSIDTRLASIVMPTGTGKTETMLASMISYVRGRLLVVVPSVALREQTAKKFSTLGMLKQLGLVSDEVPNPIVGVITRRPKNAVDLEFIKSCNVVITNIANIAQGTAADLGQEIASHFDYLMIDEAHHVPATTWEQLKQHFKDCRVLQFTATPFRRDRKPIDGKVIFNYPLGMAQKDGYFREIEFHPVLGIDKNVADKLIAKEAVKQLDTDIKAGLDHLIMARCSNISRATAVKKFYEKWAKKHSPVLITSETKKADRETLLKKLIDRKSRILVCVDMFGEGFDFPNLKIAALHDPHKSLAITLQFTGRFTRSAEKVGNAKVVADVGNSGFMDSLDDLYIEDADWNQILSEFSSEAIKSHMELIEFLSKCERLHIDDDNTNASQLSPSVLQPKYSMVCYRADKFQPNHFHKSIPQSLEVCWAWITSDKKTVFFVTRQDPKVRWSRSRRVRNREWEFFLLHFNSECKLLYLHSSDTSSVHSDLAKVTTGNTAALIHGDDTFRIFGNIQRRTFQRVGLKRPGRRNISYSSFSGQDVGTAITEAQKHTSAKSDISGTGYEVGKPVTVGCSKKGRVWSREQGSIKGLVGWCHYAGAKLTDPSIKTDEILSDTMIPTKVDTLPTKIILKVDWPPELLSRNEINVKISDTEEHDLSHFDVKLATVDHKSNSFDFELKHDDFISTYTFSIGGVNGYEVKHKSGKLLKIKSGSNQKAIESYFNDYPPSVLYVDGSELDGCLLYELTTRANIQFPTQQLTTWDWTSVDITKESKWKATVERKDSIQSHVIERSKSEGYDIVFDDDGSGEAADIVCIDEGEDNIRLVLFHCKFSGGEDSGQRIKDVIEVCSQAVKSNKWIWKFSRLCEHLARRDNRRQKKYSRTRFEAGNLATLNKIKKASRFKMVEASIYIVQPGIKKEDLSDDQANVLSSAHSYLLETVNLPLNVICS